MTYGRYSHTAHKVSSVDTGTTVWMRERSRGKILPMIQNKPSLFNRIRDSWGGGRG
jgi:hypothetical protein